MKYLILIVVFNLLGITCAKKEKCEVTLQSASWFNWFGGIPDVGGSDYSFKFLTQQCGNLKIDSVFIDGQNLKFKVKHTEDLWEITASKNTKTSSSNRNHKMSKPTTNRMVHYPQVARMVYSLNNRSSEINIDQFTQGKNQFRQ